MRTNSDLRVQSVLFDQKDFSVKCRNLNSRGKLASTEGLTKGLVEMLEAMRRKRGEKNEVETLVCS